MTSGLHSSTPVPHSIHSEFGRELHKIAMKNISKLMIIPQNNYSQIINSKFHNSIKPLQDTSCNNKLKTEEKQYQDGNLTLRRLSHTE